jgi:nucleotidyltransferase/DNA polymerase involved in DNA repair
MATTTKERQARYRARQRADKQHRLDVSVGRATLRQLHELAVKYNATNRFVVARLIELAATDLKQTGVIR